jgi:hypothetical protein
MDIRTSIFDFLRIEHLTWVRAFSPSVNYGVTVDHYNVTKSCLCVPNPIMKFNVLSESDLGVKIGSFCDEILLLSHRKTSEIVTFQKKQKIQILIFSYFLADFS